MTRVFTADEIQNIRELAAKGFSRLDIAQRLGRHRNSIDRVMRDKGIKTPRQGYLTREDIEELWRLEQQGVPRDQIARQFAITKQRVKETLTRERRRLAKQEFNSECNPYMSRLLSIRWVPEEEEW